MTTKMWFLCHVTLLAAGYLHYTSAYMYRFNFVNEEVFTPCTDNSKKYLDFGGLFNLSEMSYGIESDSVVASGNVTTIWNIEESDRIQTNMGLYRYDRGDWTKTLYSIYVVNVCNVLYNNNQHWYKMWTKYIINQDSVKDRCLYPGTKLVHENFTVNGLFDFYGPTMSGLHKIVIKLTALDLLQNEREPSICFELIGEMFRI